MTRSLLAFAAAAALAVGTGAAPDGQPPPLLLRSPAIGRAEIAFSYAGDLWLVPREGGEARRLTSAAGTETHPHFSPDGTQIAFTGEYDGNVDVFAVAAGGGVPRRLTWHPGPDEAAGWTPDGGRVLFRSRRDSHDGVWRLFTVSGAGGLPTAVPLPRGGQGSYSPDGSRLAYVPTTQWQQAWKRYRGGQTSVIWVASLADSSIERLPRENSNDFNPLWVGETVYFLSDRDGPVSLYAYDLAGRRVSVALQSDGLDFKTAAAGPGALIIEQFGALHLYDLATRQARRVEVRINADLAEVRPRHVTVEAKRIQAFGLSPTGARAVFEARGEILTVPAEKGHARNLTRTPSVAERDPAWSPDGQKVACFSDASGEYALEVRDQSGLGEPRRIALGNPPSFFLKPRWSPDGKKIAYEDKRLNIWYVDLHKGAPVRVDTNPFQFSHWLEPAWSPDSRWLAYARSQPSRLRAVFIYSLDQGKAFQVTDGMSDTLDPRFDRSGKYLYLAASTDIALANSIGDMSGLQRPVTRSAYVVVLRKELPSPLAPESDEEKPPDAQKAEEKKEEAKSATGAKDTETGKADQGKDKEEAKKPEPVRIDFEGIGQRILALPVPAANYVQLETGKEGLLFLVEAPLVTLEFKPEGPSLTVHKFDLKTRKAEKILEGVTAFTVSSNGEKVLYRRGDAWSIAAVDDLKPGEAGAGEGGSGKGALKLGELEVDVDPRAEWRQMYHEAWRIQRDFFYDPGYHGLDLAAAEKRYARYVEGVASRSELNYLFAEMLGQLSVGHMFIGGGDQPEARKVKGGLLGADYALEDGRYRFKRVYSGENWNPDLQAPLTQPGVNVAAGEYLLAVNGRELRSTDNVYAFFEATAGKSVVIKVGSKPDGQGARDVAVVPVESETGLRRRAWIEANRRKVDELTQGRIAYVYLPDTFVGGYSSFNRYYFAQLHKQGAVIDERANQGGLLADYIVDYLSRPMTGRIVTREGEERPSPEGAIYGPKVMIIDEYAGSGGDALPWYFRKTGIGPLVGKRTWGGLVGIFGAPSLMDGGFVTSPDAAVAGLTGEWEVENIGVAPDVEVELDPKAWREGRDAQLEKAVELVLEALGRTPPQTYRRPAYPNYHSPPKD